MALLLATLCSDEAIVFSAGLFNFKFYSSSYSSVSIFEHQSNLGTMPTSFRVADLTGKHSYVLNFIE